MKALILNSGLGSRMGELVKDKHKSMICIEENKELIIHQLNILKENGIKDFFITTGHMSEKLVDLINTKFNNECNITFIYNERYLSTNYIFSMYLGKDLFDDDMLILHGDLYFDIDTIKDFISKCKEKSLVAVDLNKKNPDKDFKALIEKEKVKKISTQINSEKCYASQPLYYVKEHDLKLWCKKINEYYLKGMLNVYAEEALNDLLEDNEVNLSYYNLNGKLCMEVDTPEDYYYLKGKVGGNK